MERRIIRWCSESGPGLKWGPCQQQIISCKIIRWSRVSVANFRVSRRWWWLPSALAAPLPNDRGHHRSSSQSMHTHLTSTGTVNNRSLILPTDLEIHLPLIDDCHLNNLSIRWNYWLLHKWTMHGTSPSITTDTNTVQNWSKLIDYVIINALTRAILLSWLSNFLRNSIIYLCMFLFLVTFFLRVTVSLLCRLQAVSKIHYPIYPI